jgi:hypothetical protein
MATAKKISQLTAVVTPAGSDTLAAVQGSTTKKLTVTQLLTLASGGTSWEIVTGADTIEAGEGFLVEDGGATFDITIAATIAAKEEFVIHNNSTSTGTVTIEPNTGHTIKGPGGSVVGGTDTILIEPGETIRLVAISTSVLEIV